MTGGLMALMMKKQAGAVVAGIIERAQAERDALALECGPAEADALIEEMVSLLMQLDTASAGKVMKALAEMAAIGAVRNFMK